MKPKPPISIENHVEQSCAVSSQMASLYLGVSRSHIDALLKKNRLMRVRVGNGTRTFKLVDTESLRTYKAARDGTKECQALITKRLTELAKKGATVTYTEAMAWCDLNPKRPLDRQKIGRLLGAVSGESFRQRKVLLSVLVVAKTGKKMPNQSFFTLAKKLGAKSRETSNEEFFEQHKRKVFKTLKAGKA